ncbi:MAG: hypothetical protein LBK56_06865 [Gracilibacteraceae bacterium]|nr:hypothetical protein [Gracilibacteraceae bacterium]
MKHITLPPKPLMPYLMHENESGYKGYYYLQRFQIHKIVIVVDDSYRAVGILTPGDFAGDDLSAYDGLDNKRVGDFCNKNFQFIRANEDKYSAGRNLFADAGMRIHDIPVLDQAGVPVDIFARWQAFYKEYQAAHRLQRPYYAEPIMQAAELARAKGCDEISVIEFGVAGGTGLLLAELYARETERLTGVKIQTYGFDRGDGLPEITACDLSSPWVKGDFPMELRKLQNQLQRSKLILGDITDTCKTFFDKYAPAPIGAMFVDVDLYEPTVAILDMLLASDDFFLPTVYMYFDDIRIGDCLGELLAVKDFNAKSKNSKITPEGLTGGQVMGYDDTLWWSKHLKRNIRFSHPKIANDRVETATLNLQL